MFDVKNLSISLDKNSIEIIKNLNLSINNNTKLAIIGEEGNGKSTIIKALAGVDISSYANISGKIVTDKSIGYLPQTFENYELDMTISEFLTTDKNGDKCYYIYNDYGGFNKLLNKFNLPISILDDDKKLKILSGGERLKIALVKCLSLNPQVLLLDEPTNDLDIETIKILEEFIKTYNGPIIFVSHDEELLENTANSILHIERLKRKTESKWTFENIGYKSYIEKRLKSHVKQDQIASSEKSKFEAKMERWRHIHERVNYELNAVSRQDPHTGRLLAKKMKTVQAQKKKLDKEKEQLPEFSESEESIFLRFKDGTIDKSRKVYSLHDYEVKINNRILSQNVTIEVFGKDKIIIIGKNGVGKTTLIKKIVDDLNQNKTIKVGYFPQDLNDEFSSYKTVIDYICENLHSKEEQTMARTYLGSLKITEEEMLGDIKNLSGGTRMKIKLARLMVDGCDIIVMDEPTRNLSPLSNPVLRRELSNYSGAIIAVSHDRKFIQEVGTCIYKLESDGLKEVTNDFKINNLK